MAPSLCFKSTLVLLPYCLKLRWGLSHNATGHSALNIYPPILSPKPLSILKCANSRSFASPMKKKGGTSAGIPRSGERNNSPVGNGLSSATQVSHFSAASAQPSILQPTFIGDLPSMDLKVLGPDEPKFCFHQAYFECGT
jgi:hypothetical protein